MDNHNAGIEASGFANDEDKAARARDEAAVQLARQVHEWAKDNLGRFDNDGNKRNNFAELDLAKRTSNNKADLDALDYLQTNYKDIQKHSQSQFLFIKGAKGVSTDGIGEYADTLERRRIENEERRQAAIQERALQAGSKHLAQGLLQTGDGNPNSSLFRVIDGLDGDIDDEISKGDLNRYLETYQKRARYGDINSGHFNSETRRYVEYLRDNWDSNDIVRLRGTYTTRDNDGREREIANRKISEESLKKAIGVAEHSDMFAAFTRHSNNVKAEKVSTELRHKPEVVVSEIQDQDTTAASSARAAQAPKLESAEAPKPKAVEASKPKAAEAPKPKAAEAPKPKAAEAPKPKAAEAPKPKVAETPNPEAIASKAAVTQAADEKAIEADALQVPSQEIEPMDITGMVADRIRNHYEKSEQYHAAADEEAAAQDIVAITRSVTRQEWAKDNLLRFDTTGDKRLNYAELDLGIRTTRGESRSMLKSIQNDYEFLKEQSGGQFLFVQRPDAISHKDLEVDVEKNKEAARKNEQIRQEAAQYRLEQANNKHLLSGLLSSGDGNPNRTLFRVIDGLDNDIDNEISRRDLGRYLDEYQKRARYGDVGRGFFTSSTRTYVEYLKENWDSTPVKTLRGTYTDNEHRQQAYDHIKLSRLNQLLGLSKHTDIFSQFSLEDRR